MYFPIGWPKYFSSKDVHCGELKALRYNRDRSLLAVISDHSVCIWNDRVRVDTIWYHCFRIASSVFTAMSAMKFLEALVWVSF